MSLASLNRYALVAVAALSAQVATAAPPHGGGHAPGPAAHGHVGPAPVAHNHGHVGTGYYSGYRPLPYNYGGYGGYRGVGIGIGIGFGSGYGLYGPLNYGLGGSPFGYGGLGAGGLGYGALGYGYGYPGTRATVGVPATVGTTVVAGSSPLTSAYSTPLPPISNLPQPGGDPVPQPLPTPAGAAAGEPAVITVITSEGATVSFDGLASEQTGTRHSFTTRPLPGGVQTRVSIKVTKADGRPSTVTLGVAGGEKATVDMRN
jgi:uncharacterized protein (TIGR03000 family)